MGCKPSKAGPPSYKDVEECCDECCDCDADALLVKSDAARDALEVECDLKTRVIQTISQDNITLRTERDSLKGERDALKCERDALKTAHNALTEERNSLLKRNKLLWSAKQTMDEQCEEAYAQRDVAVRCAERCVDYVHREGIAFYGSTAFGRYALVMRGGV